MALFTTLQVFCLLIVSVQSVVPRASVYQLDASYAGGTFFDGFDFFTEPDPTNGFVSFVSRSSAQAAGLIFSYQNSPVFIGVDRTTVLDPAGPGRRSVRISSKRTWTHGLFISDISHMPGGICGTWPAHWTLGPNWPYAGEIDIIEGVNSGQMNAMSLHTSPNCQMPRSSQLGTVQTTNCDTSVNYNSGCGTLASTPLSYGTGFNNNHGGIYAMEWTSDHIRIWFFPRNSIPANVVSKNPDPNTWGKPMANFQGGAGCNIDGHFANHKIIFDTTFCGDWADAVWGSDVTCRAKARTCKEFVAKNPRVFADAYWSINSVKAYKLVASGVFAQAAAIPDSNPRPTASEKRSGSLENRRPRREGLLYRVTS